MGEDGRDPRDLLEEMVEELQFLEDQFGPVRVVHRSCEASPVDAEEHDGGVIVSYGEDGEPVSVEFLSAADRGMIEPGGLSVQLQRDEASA